MWQVLGRCAATSLDLLLVLGEMVRGVARGFELDLFLTEMRLIVAPSAIALSILHALPCMDDALIHDCTTQTQLCTRQHRQEAFEHPPVHRLGPLSLSSPSAPARRVAYGTSTTTRTDRTEAG